MLRVGLTGKLGSGKSTVTAMLAARGAIVFSSDEMGRALMQPGQRVFHEIVTHFGSSVLRADGSLDRGQLAALAFDPAQPRVEELNAIVHPAVLAAQARRIAEIAATDPDAIVVVESALLLAVQGWQERFEQIVVVTAPRVLQIARFVARGGDVADAERRLAQQRVTPPPGSLIVRNEGGLMELEEQVDRLWQQLRSIEERG